MHRQLNEFEYFNWCFGQPYNMVAAVQLRGDLRAERLRAALDKAQERHPLLGVNTEPSPSGVPCFASAGVGPIPLTVLRGAAPDAARALAERELSATFEMDSTATPRLPLMRVALVLPQDEAQPSSLVFTAQHVIADGLSMVFLLRDLLRFMEEPDAPVEVLDAPADAADLLPPRVRRWTPTSPLPFRVAAALLRAYVRLRFGSTPPPRPACSAHHRSWQLTREQTARLRARCRREGVSVQTALCTAFLPAFGVIHTPVSLRAHLARPVGEAIGLFVGSADVGMKYRDELGFWDNARRFHRRLRRALRNPFRIFQLCSTAVPADEIRRLGPSMLAIAGAGRPFGITNLGVLDGSGVALAGRDLRVESFFGAVSGVIESSILTVYTIEGSMRFDLLASESSESPTGVRDDADRALAALQAATAD